DLGRVTKIIDTLGREINFNYDSNLRLQSITQLRGSQTHAWATFGYADLTVETNFRYPCNGDEEALESGECEHPDEQGLPRNRIIAVLTRVGLDDGSRYDFDYTTWGQIHKIHHLAADNHQLTYTAYNLPLDATSHQETDCPRFTVREDWVENWNN